jgi:hypothetical protein
VLGLVLLVDVPAAGLHRGEEAAVKGNGIDGPGELGAEVGGDADAPVVEDIPDVHAVELEI